ncbi:MAG: ABC transporter ATP-binding protein [Ornithinimicrobium sp.]
MSPTTTAALRCRHLVKRFAGEVAVDDVDLRVDPGEVVALVGLNGAGKTTLMRMVLAMCRPDSGGATVFGCSVATAGREQWRRVGHMIETPFAYPELTTLENVWASARLHGLSRQKSPHAAARIIDRLDLGAYAGRRACALSQGNRQRLGLASAMVHSPRLLVLDEPTNALDPGGVVLLRDLVRSAAREGTAILVSSHHLDEVARVADRVEVIHRGRLIGELAPGGSDLEHAFFEMAHAAEGEPAAAGHSDERLAGGG